MSWWSGEHSADGVPVGPARRMDLRLAGLALATWLSALGALHTSMSAAICAAIACGVAAGGLAIAATRSSCRAGNGWFARWQWVIAGVLLGVVCGASATAARLAERDAGPLVELTRSAAVVQADLVVRNDPRRLAGVAGRPPAYLIAAQLTGVRRSPGPADSADPAGTAQAGAAPVVRLSVRVLVLASDPSWYDLLPGQRVEARGRLDRPRGADLTAAVLSASGRARRIGAPPWIQRAAGSLRAGLQRACAPLADEPGGLLPGLVIGDTSRLDPAVAENFRSTGMNHLTAVSGSNVAVIVGAALLLARWARAGPRLSAAVCALALVGFVILARPSPSVLRAAAMGTLGLIALAVGRSRGALPALCAAVAGLVVADPELSVDAGFALSVLATGGLLVLAPRWRDGLRRRGVPGGLAEALAVPAAAQVACAPVVAAISAAVSLVAIPANLLAIPAVAPATVLGVLAAIVSPLWPAAAGFAAWLAAWPAWWLVIVARYGAGLPAGVLPWPGGPAGGLLLAALTGAVLLAARRRLARRLVAVVAAAIVVGALPVRLVTGGWPPPDWVLVVCSVGQGDAVVLPVAPGQAVVVDAGPEPTATDACLRRLGVRVVPLLVVSHFHADHVGGIAGVFRGRSVAALLTTAWAEPATGRAAVLRTAAARGTPVYAAEVGRSYQAGGIVLTVIGPPHRMTGTRSDPNNNSLVLSTRVRGVRMLLAGDAEREEQEAILGPAGGPDGGPIGSPDGGLIGGPSAAVGGPGADGAASAVGEMASAPDSGAAGDATGGTIVADLLKADVMKIAHHGSAFQDPRFLDAVDPVAAIASVGAGNRYGHPNAAVLARLARQGARVLRTDQSGDVAVVRTGRGVGVAIRGP